MSSTAEKVQAVFNLLNEQSNALSDIASWCDGHDYEDPKTDPREIAEAVANTVQRLRALEDQVVKHHAARGHDRCWENDAELYQAAGLEPGDPQIPEPTEFMQRCRAYCEEQTGQPVPEDSVIVHAARVVVNNMPLSRSVVMLRDALAEHDAKAEAAAKAALGHGWAAADS